MTRRDQGVTHQGVLFFEGDRLAREMLYVEFEALLDQVVGLPDFAGQEARACFVLINARLQIVATVFFLVDFDQRGYVNRSWNVPLQHLLDNAGRGPDLGAGRIRLACRSQCSIPWHVRQLWDPIFDGDDNMFEQLRVAILGNRLGLPVDVEPPVLEVPAVPTARSRQRKARATPHPAEPVEHFAQHLEKKYADKVQALEEAHHLQQATYQSALREQIEQLRQRHQSQIGQMQESLEASRQQVRTEKQKRRLLKAQMDERIAEIQQHREDAQRALAAERGSENERVQLLTRQLQQDFEAELAMRVEQARVELKEMLEMREVELFYREEQLGILREEIARLRQERELLISQSGNRLLDHLTENGIAFVTYHPGVEAMTIPAGEVARYLESPLAYVAAKCFVSVEHYQAWLNHFDVPVCGALLAEGATCGASVAKVERPSEFCAGDSDRCERHGALAVSLELQHVHGAAPEAAFQDRTL